MSTTELRKRLFEKIEKTDDYELLKEAYRLLASEAEEGDVYATTYDQRQAILEARKQVENGQYLSEEEANKESDEWLSK